MRRKCQKCLCLSTVQLQARVNRGFKKNSNLWKLPNFYYVWHFKMSHSIHMLSIQIDTKSLVLVSHHQFNSIKLSSLACHMKQSFMKQSFPLCTFIRSCGALWKGAIVGRLLLGLLTLGKKSSLSSLLAEFL